MVADRAGNSLSNARRIILSATAKTFKDFIGGRDRDYYRFRAADSSQFSLQMDGLTANANVALLNSQGKTLSKSVKAGTRVESIQSRLNAGTYYVVVYPKRPRENTNYNLTLSVAAAGVTNSPFNIQFDYRFDTQGFFTSEKRAVLEAAAALWENIIQDEFANTPVGTRVQFVDNPETGELLASDFVVDRLIDDVLIFVGARDLQGFSGSTLALAGPAGSASSTDGADFEPSVGTIAFNVGTDWFYDPTPTTDTDLPVNQQDFLSTTAHEIAHVLGFGTSIAFDNLVSGSAFAGANALARNGGNSIPLGDSAHITDGYQFGGSGQTLMSPFAERGVRKRPTALDVAVLDDIGYTVNYSAVSMNAPLLERARSGDRTLQGAAKQRSRRRQVSLLSSGFGTSGSGTSGSGTSGSGMSVYGTCGCACCLVGQVPSIRKDS